jgi:hypothetical protein
MNYNTITDEEVLEAVEGSLSAVSMRRPIESITTRGRGLRKRRRALSGAAMAGALGVSVAVALPLSGAGGGQRLSANGHTVNVDMAGWSVHTAADATVTVTVRQQLFGDPRKLQSVLNNAGVHALVRDLSIGYPNPGCGLHGETTSPQIAQALSPQPPGKSADERVVTIHPGAMPPGSVLDISVSHDNLITDHNGHPTTGTVRVVSISLLTAYPDDCVPPPWVSERK